MKKYSILHLFVFVFVLLASNCEAQNGVSIGSGTVADNSSILDLQSTSKGFLPPRLTTYQRTTISAPAAGLIVFDTDKAQLYLYDGTSWQPLVAGNLANKLYPSQVEPPANGVRSFGFFGIDVDVFGNYAVVGAPGIDSGSTFRTGAVYVYKKSTTGSWLQVAKLYASDYQADAFFGGSVAIHGNYIVVGAPGQDVAAIADAGKIYVFVKGAGDTWSQQTSFTKPGTAVSQDYFGYNVDISTTTSTGPSIITGSPFADLGGTNRGAAYAYRYNGSSWVLLQTINPADLGVNNRFGWKMSVDGDYCAISAPKQDDISVPLTAAGAVYIYVFGGGVWTLQQKLSGTTGNASFGYSLSLQANRLAVGAPSAVWYPNATSEVVVYDRGGSTWTPISHLYFYQLPGFDVSSQLGISVALDGDLLLVSAPAGYLEHFNSSFAAVSKDGIVCVYKASGSTYVLQKVVNDISPLPPASSNAFGNSVSLSNGNYVIGIPLKPKNGIVRSGAVAFGFLE